MPRIIFTIVYIVIKKTWVLLFVVLFALQKDRLLSFINNKIDSDSTDIMDYILHVIYYIASSEVEYKIIWGIAVFVVLVVFVHAYFDEYRAKNKHELNGRDASVSVENSVYVEPFPDITIDDFFSYVKNNSNLSDEYPEISSEYPDSIVGKAVKDKLSTEQLNIWGRESDWADAFDDDFSSNVLKKLEFKDFDNFIFTFLWDDYDESIKLTGVAELARRIHAKYDEDGVETNYLDLRFNKAEMRSIWPEE